MSAWSESALNRLLVRYADLIPSDAGRLEGRAAGPSAAQDFSIISSAVEHPAAGHVHIGEPHDFDLIGIRHAFGCVTAAYCIDATEVFISHCGRWRLLLGPNGEDDSVTFATGDVVSVPPGVYRRTEKLDEGTGFLFVVRGSNAGRIPTWSPAVFASATDAGMNLMTGGRWIDSSSGTLLLKESEPEGSAKPAVDPDAWMAGKLSDCVITEVDIAPNTNSPLAADGVEEASIISSGGTRDGFSTGPIKSWWPHGFSLRQMTLQSGAYIPMQSRMESEVLMLHEGTLEVSWSDGAIMLGAGDTLTVPVGLPHAVRNTTSRVARAFVVRGSEDPAMPVFQSRPVRD